MKIKIMIVLLALLAVSATLRAQDAAPAKNSKAATLDFFLLDRLPRNALVNTVVTIGDDYFTSERYGLESVMRRLFNDVLIANTSYRMAAADPPAVPDPAIEEAFLYFAGGDDPQGYFDVKKIGALADSMKDDLLIVGLVHQLTISKNMKSLEGELVKMKVSVLVYETATGTFIQSKTYEKESKDVAGLPDFDLLPKKNGRVPSDILKFAESETGRVFLSLLPSMIADIPNSGKVEPFLSGDYAAGSGKSAKQAHVISGGTANIEQRTGSGPECEGSGRSALAALAGKSAGIRIYPCLSGNYDFTQPEIETAAIPDSKQGLGSLAAGDFDGDGVDEFAVTTLDPGEYVRFYKIGNGTFNPAEPWQEISDVMNNVNFGLHSAAGDFNGDGRDELALSSDRAGDYTVFLEYRNGKIARADSKMDLFNVFGASGRGANVAAGDFNGDGLAEIAIASDGAGEMIKVYSVLDAKATGPKQIGELNGYFEGTSDSSSIAAGDFNGDGRDELAVSSLDGGVSVKVFRFGEKGFDLKNTLGEISADWSDEFNGARVAAGDFDGDGRDELALSTTGGAGKLWIFKYNKGRFILSKPYLEGAALYPKAPYGILITAGQFE
ncbi:MAG: VCBS repeat-containing protein [bacterium]